jgi:hypothetical protein
MAHNDLILLDKYTSVDPYAVVAVYTSGGIVIVLLEGGQQVALHGVNATTVTEIINNAINADFEE